MKGTNLLIFALGAAMGAFVSYEIAKRKFSELAQEEIKSVKDVYAQRAAAREKPDLSEFSDIVKDEGYSSGATEDEKPVKKSNDKPPYVISSDDFGTIDDYEQIGLTLYSDGVLADEDDEVVEDVEKTIGTHKPSELEAFLNGDSLFIRNETLKADYEILFDTRKYSDVVSKSPHKIG